LGHPGFMIPRSTSGASAPFLPLAFRFAASFGLLVLHLALPLEGSRPAPGEGLYVAILLLLLLESIGEMAQSHQRSGQIFGTPGPRGVRLNLFLDILLVTVLVAFQGVDQERFGPLFIFPVLASAFYLAIPGIVGVGVGSALCHALLVVLFASGILPAFGQSGRETRLEAAQLSFMMTFTSLQVFFATLVVVLIRKHVETLRLTLQRSEAAVDELSELYRRVFESMFAGLVTTDLEGQVTSANPAAQSILQRQLPAGTQLEDLGIVNFTDHGRLPREQRFERSFTVAGGEARIIGGNVAPLRDGQGTQRGHLVLFQDLTELKALEARTVLNGRLAAIGELSAELAHELRNPMASILGCIQILQGEDQPPAMRDRVLNILKRESQRVSAIVTDFLVFARPRELKLEPLWLPQVMEDFRASWDTDPQNLGVPLEMDPPPDCWITGDPVSVHQVFSNLLSNSRKALEGVERPSLRIHYTPTEGALQITVEDNGCGMDEARLKNLFLPFTSGFKEGTGLGMSVVFQLVQRMGWDIHAESWPGKGTRILLSIQVSVGEAG